MILSRARPVSRAAGSVVNNLLQGNKGSNFKQSTRTKAWTQYRNPIPPDAYVKDIRRPYQIFSVVLWWWIVWRLGSEFEQFVGPPMPKMSDWTDEELGIPPIDEDP